MRILLTMALTAFSSAVSAQTFEANNNFFETPIGLSSVRDIDSPATRTRDENFNRIEVDTASGGRNSATAIGNLLNVVVIGSNHTVNVNARQVNNGNQSAVIYDDGNSDQSEAENSDENTAEQ